MRLELFPLIVGAIVGLIGLGLVVDAWTPDDVIVKRERRRRMRAGRHRGGEAAIGLGVLGMAAALVGRDTWRYSVVSAIAGVVLVLYGVIRSRHYLAQSFANRGALRRREPDR